MKNNSVCDSCNHPLDLHVEAVTGNRICLHIRLTTAWDADIYRCDCVNRFSKFSEEEKVRNKKEREEATERINKIVEETLKQK
jgi:hypothetical protein